MSAPTRTTASGCCVALLVLAVALSALPSTARGAASWALASDCPEGRVGFLIGFQQSTNAQWAAIPIPVWRPTLRAELVGGLPGPLDIAVGGHFGHNGIMRAEYEIAAGLRLAPFDLWSDRRLAVALTGGARAVPGIPTYPDGSMLDHPAVGMTRLELLYEGHARRPGAAFLLRVRYETHWLMLLERTHAERITETGRPFVASHLVELRVGLVSRPDLPASFMLETGLYVYIPQWEEENVLHVGLIISLAAAMGPDPHLEVMRN
jgi:hypothetical protein